MPCLREQVVYNALHSIKKSRKKYIPVFKVHKSAIILVCNLSQAHCPPLSRGGQKAKIQNNLSYDTHTVYTFDKIALQNNVK